MSHVAKARSLRVQERGELNAPLTITLRGEPLCDRTTFDGEAAGRATWDRLPCPQAAHPSDGLSNLLPRPQQPIAALPCRRCLHVRVSGASLSLRAGDAQARRDQRRVAPRAPQRGAWYAPRASACAGREGSRPQEKMLPRSRWKSPSSSPRGHPATSLAPAAGGCSASPRAGRMSRPRGSRLGVRLHHRYEAASLRSVTGRFGASAPP